MAQQPHQFPIYPILPSMNPLPMPVHLPPTPMPYLPHVSGPAPSVPGFSAEQVHPSTAKRRRDSGDEPAYESGTKRRAVALDVIFRILVPSRQIGKVIGKEGYRIQKIREDTKATIKIADAIVEDDSSNEALKIGAAHVAANTIRLLIAGSQAGGLIGISGENIEKLRNSSGATITVLAPTQLPLCASAHESDRVVQLSGDVPAVLSALEEIGHQLRENPPRQVISISPAYNYSSIRPTQSSIDPNSADYVTFEMLISETLVGGLIGRAGSNISRIRNETGAMIKVYGGRGEQKHRHIQFGGNAQQVALAKQKVDEYIYSQLIQQPDA
ncbi:poly(rC)-binding protein 4-like isoform X2 [Punica granatum]|uniref:Poly(RC)-binding protein 4-like isoform X2 n=1 Tax=Punica granatum TaxID=22663 RepID=A0A6P8DEJ2_PUNGR|nr:poly(rC)-binding protein 4-like isoform X2 [Punica granatum]